MVTGCPSAIHVAHKDRNKGTREEVRDVGPINILCNILYCDLISQSYVFTGWRCYLRKNEVATRWRMRAIQRETKPKERYHCDSRTPQEEKKNLLEQLRWRLNFIFVTGLCGQLGGSVRSQNGFKSTLSERRACSL